MVDKVKTQKFKFKLGSRVRDTITSFEGIVTHRSQWLNGCNTYGVQPEILKDGAPQKSQVFDEPQLELVNEKVHKATRKTGGPPREVEQPNR